MTFSRLASPSYLRPVALLAGALALAACASEDVDVTTGSRLEQPPAGTQPAPPIEAGDIAIAGQDFSHAIRQLPEIADAAKPPLVQFTGVTSIVNGPVDTEPYTNLLRDRLLLGDREKLRFVERQLPPLTTHHTVHKKDVASTGDMGAEAPDYRVLAELRGKPDADFFRIQIEFVNLHSGEVLFNGVYRIRKESPGSSDAMSGQDSTPPPSQPAPSTDNSNLPLHDATPPPPEQVTPPPGGWQDGSATGAPPVFHE
jgi:PBP1b-binding outer membrane lipoprotein LpoB